MLLTHFGFWRRIYSRSSRVGSPKKVPARETTNVLSSFSWGKVVPKSRSGIGSNRSRLSICAVTLITCASNATRSGRAVSTTPRATNAMNILFLMYGRKIKSTGRTHRFRSAPQRFFIEHVLSEYKLRDTTTTKNTTKMLITS